MNDIKKQVEAIASGDRAAEFETKFGPMWRAVQAIPSDLEVFPTDFEHMRDLIERYHPTCERCRRVSRVLDVAEQLLGFKQ